MKNICKSWKSGIRVLNLDRKTQFQGLRHQDSVIWSVGAVKLELRDTFSKNHSFLEK